MSLRLILCLALAVISVPVSVFGRITKAWTYQELFDNADLVVIAKAVSTKDTDERTTLKDLTPNVPVVGILTKFETRLLLKGSAPAEEFELHHYRFESADAELWVDAPILIEISNNPNGTQHFLMFLVKEPDGKYAPVGGQTDPAITSVIELRSSAM